jgi:rSAM/selenodomain-associated transferase 2
LNKAEQTSSSRNPKPMVSVIIPTLNEEDALGATLGSLQSFHEVLVADAGSEDGTAEIARVWGAGIFLSSKKQRAAQLNLGAENAKGEALLFLHADTVLPESGIVKIEAALKDEAVIGGGFARRFDSRSLFLRMTCLLAEIRNRTIGWHLGDQAIFVRAHIFRELGGFKTWDRFEDLDFSRRMAERGKIVTLRPPVVSSARRFNKLGPARTTLRDFWWTVEFLRGDKKSSLISREAAKPA